MYLKVGKVVPSFNACVQCRHHGILRRLPCICMMCFLHMCIYGRYHGIVNITCLYMYDRIHPPASQAVQQSVSLLSAGLQAGQRFKQLSKECQQTEAQYSTWRRRKGYIFRVKPTAQLWQKQYLLSRYSQVQQPVTSA